MEKDETCQLHSGVCTKLNTLEEDIKSMEGRVSMKLFLSFITILCLVMTFFSGMIYKLSDNLNTVDKSSAVMFTIQNDVLKKLGKIDGQFEKLQVKLDNANNILITYNTELNSLKGIIKLLHKDDLEKANEHGLYD